MSQNIPTHSMLRPLAALVLAAGLLPGCDDGSDPFDEGRCSDGTCAIDDDRGQAQNLEYACTTSTMAPTGTWWRYHARNGYSGYGFNNNDQQITLDIHKGAEPGDNDNYTSIGEVTLPKVGTDTWSDGNLTVALGLKSANAGEHYGSKSIRVDHASVGISAGVDNGYCESQNRVTIGQGGFDPVDDNASIKAILGGEWRHDGDGSLDLGFSLTNHGNDEASGFVSYLTHCSVTQPSHTPDGPSFPSTNFGAIVSLVSIVLNEVDNANCVQSEDKFVTKNVEARFVRYPSQLRKSAPSGFCPNSSNFFYGEVWNRTAFGDAYHAGWLCISAEQDRMTIRSQGYSGGASDWVTLYR